MSWYWIVLLSIGGYITAGLFASRMWYIRALRQAAGTVRHFDRYGDYVARSLDAHHSRPATLKDLYKSPNAQWRAFWVIWTWPFIGFGNAFMWVLALAAEVTVPAIKAFYSDPHVKKPDESSVSKIKKAS